jgi:hypothetical protein
MKTEEERGRKRKNFRFQNFRFQRMTVWLFTHPVHPVYPCSLLFQDMKTWMDRMDRMQDAEQ